MDVESKLLAEKDVEIERLKESAKYDAFLKERYRAVIAELLDALLWEHDEDDELIKRARDQMSDIFEGKTDEHIIHFKETLLYMLGLAEAKLMKRAREATNGR